METIEILVFWSTSENQAFAEYNDFAAESYFVSVQGIPPSLRAQEAIGETYC